MTALLAVHLAATCYMAGIIWLVQLVHYPMMGRVGGAFDDCQKFHLSRMGVVVGPVMVVEMASAAGLCWTRPGNPVWSTGLALLIGIWISTFVVQVPKHDLLACGYNEQAHAALVRTNWLRTVLWTLRAILALWASIK